MQATWDLAVSGDRRAIETIIERHQDAARSGAAKYRLTARTGIASDADDAAQAALLYAWECFAAGSFADKTEAEFAKWLRHVAFNRARLAVNQSRCKKRGGGKIISGDNCDVMLRKGGSDYVAELELHEVIGTDPQYVAVLDGMIAGKTMREMADEHAMKISSVKYLMGKIRDKVAAEYGVTFTRWTRAKSAELSESSC